MTGTISVNAFTQPAETTERPAYRAIALMDVVTTAGCVITSVAALGVGIMVEAAGPGASTAEKVFGALLIGSGVACGALGLSDLCRRNSGTAETLTY